MATDPASELLVVVVLSFNKREHVLRCLESVRRLRYQPREVIVVDNHSSDGSADAVAGEHPEVYLVRSEFNRGAAGGRNLGIKHAMARFRPAYLLFLDDDTIVDERLADELVSAARRDPSVGMATPKAYRTGAPELIAAAGGMEVRLGQGYIRDIGTGLKDLGQFDQEATVESCVGFAVLARREVMERCGGFDERYNPYGWEEVDLSLRIREAGYTIRYAPTAVCWHAGGTPGRGRRLAEYEKGKVANYFRLMRRHASPGQWATFLAVLPLRATRLIALQLRDGGWTTVRAAMAGLLPGRQKGSPDGPESR